MSLNLLAHAKSKFKSFLNLYKTPIIKDETKFLVAQRGVSRKVDEEEQLHCSIISTNNKFSKLEKHLKYPIPQGKDYHDPLSICNGLLLLSLPGSYDYDKREMIKPPGEALWNPTTGEYRVLPLPLSNFDPSPWCMNMFHGYFGFGFDSASEDYKVIRLFNQSDGKTEEVWNEHTMKTLSILEIWVWDGSWSLESNLTIPTDVDLQSVVGTDEEIIFLDSFGKMRFFDCETSKLKKIHRSYDYYKREMTKPPGVALWNPTTGEYKILPLPLSNIDPSPWCRTMFGGYFGFGFDSASEDYKVIRLFNQSDDRTAAVLAEVYSLRSNSWKQVSVVHPLCFPHGSGVYGVHVNGTYYWLNLSDPGFIVSFDFATEKFASSLIPTPPSNNLIREDAYEYYYANLKLVEYCGLLGAVVMWNEGNGKISCCLEIWVWDGSWSLESTLTVPSYVGLQSLVGTDEELIFLDSFGKTRFFDCETSKLKKIHSLPTSEEAHIFPLVESYVPL
ncbi:F-box family protein [Striga asiatica]|uniref:F-box family protein n=1 Tax=Striga asiatica TaxID=4170 RepID=A0A5A7RHY2_STRAF|nr:F-box family protein [Striga asiatica]